MRGPRLPFAAVSDEPAETQGWFASRRARLERTLADARERSAVVEVALECIDRWGRVNASVVAGHIAFRSFMWLLPMVLLVVALLGFATASDIDLAEAGNLVNLGRGTIDSVTSSAREAEASRVQVGLAAVAGVALGSRALVKAANLAFAQVWEIPDRKPKGLVAAAFRFLGGAILVVMAIGFTVALKERGFVGQTVGLGTSMVLDFLLVLGISLGLPRRADDWRQVVPGAFAGMLMLVLLRWFSVFYLPGRIDRYQELYGPIGLSLVFLTYLFLIASILVATAVVNSVWWDTRSRFPTVVALLGRIPGPRVSGGAPRRDPPPGDAAPR